MKVYTVKMASRKGATEFKVLTAGEMVSSRLTSERPGEGRSERRSKSP